MKKKTKKVLLIVAVVLVLCLLGGSYGIGAMIVEASTRLVTNEQTMELYEGSWELEGFDPDRFLSRYEIETVKLPSSFDDHTLPIDVITGEGGKGIVVMAHGMLGNRLTNYPTAEIFLENGYQVLSYDQRSSGENFAERSTFGFWEKYDLIDCIAYARTRFPGDRIIVWGESFGGATAILGVASGEVQQDVSAMILDCPVTDMAFMVQDSMEQMNIPLPMGYLMACGDFVNRQKLGFSYADADGIAAAETITVPVLIFNSKADEITPEFMGKELYDHLASEQKVLWTSESCAHIEIRNHEREEYIRQILDFLR